MNIEISGCVNCPFKVVDYDDFAVGNDTLINCSLAEYLQMDEYYINSYDTKNYEEYEDEELVTPSWCPVLKNKEINIKYYNKL